MIKNLAKGGDKVVYIGELYHHVNWLLTKNSIYIVKDIICTLNSSGYLLFGFDIPFHFNEFKKLSEYRKLKLEHLKNLK